MAEQFLNVLVTTNLGTSDTVDHPGGPGAVMVQGTFSGATFTLQFQIKTGSWTLIPGAAFTSDGLANFQLPACKLRVVWSGGNQDMETTSVACG